MQLFACNQCGCVDNAELAFAGEFPIDPSEQKCTLCKTGTWHDIFPQLPYDPQMDEVCNRPTGIGLGSS